MIRRYRLVNGKPKWETYPKKNWGHLNESEVAALISRLNATHESKRRAAEERYNYDHAFINNNTLEAFEHFIKTSVSDRDHIKVLMYYVCNYALKYFVRTKQLADPSHWKRYESGFGKFLLSEPLGVSAVTRIIATTNRFINFLHESYPEEVRLIVLRPLTAEDIKALSKKSTNINRNKFITESDFKLICEKAAPDILPALKLSYYFGLRVSEVLGLTEDDVYTDCLRVERQLEAVRPFRKTGPLKGGAEPRDIPYWFTTPEETYELIKCLNLMHPKTLSHFVTAEMERLELPFKHHDFRRTFITRANRIYSRADVKLAAGHKDSRTTDRYIQDDRLLKKTKYKPKALKVVE